MQRDLVKDLELLEKSGDFWTLGRNNVLLGMIAKEPVFDVGAGSGILTKELAKTFQTYALDIDARACQMCEKFTQNVICAPFDKLNGANLPKFGTIILADVIEHVGDDGAMLDKAHELLSAGGELIISVPYSNFLWTENDVARGHVRRYDINELRRKVEHAGFKVKKVFFWNLLAVFPILIAKLFSMRVPHEGIAESRFNKLLLSYFKNFENKLPLPVGSALICKATKEK